MWVSRCLIFFVVISFLGWVYEMLYARLRRGKWENRGFLYGPILPIYGVGALCLLMVCQIMAANGHEDPAWWEIFLISCLGSVVLEYVTSWGLEKLFHARWWDYSKVPLNFQGRVCVPAALVFGVAGVMLIYWIAPVVNGIIDMVPPIWIEVIGLIIAGVLAVDLVLTVVGLTNLKKKIWRVAKKINRYRWPKN